MIKIGTQFRHHYADGNCLWTVTEKRGRGTWIAEISADELDYAGVHGAFTTEQIEAHINWSKSCAKSQDDSSNFFDALKPGSIVHYSNGFKQYVRCQVTQDHQLLPIALVGDWRVYDLPRRGRDGIIYLGYHAEQIKNGKTFRPHASNVWEFNLTKTKNHQPMNFAKWTNPCQLVPMSLEVPTMTADQFLDALKYQKLEAVREIVKDNDAKPEVIFERLKVLLQSA
jgi:hypothetical protein